MLTMNSLATVAKERVNLDWDLTIGITGEEGVGKSSLAIQLAEAIDPSFDLEKSVAYLPTYKEMINKFNSLQPKQVFLIDEAVKVLYKLRWQDELQKQINEMYATERSQNKVSIFCMPRFSDFTERFRNWRIKIWIHVIERGIAVVFIKDDLNPFSTDPWYTKENDKRITKTVMSSSILTATDKIAKLKKCKTFQFAFTFPQLEPVKEATYKDLKLRSRERTPEKDDRTKELIRKLNELFFWVWKNCYIREPDGSHRRIFESEIATAWDIDNGNLSRILKEKEDKNAMLT